MFNEPGIGRATKIVYEALGYHITLADAGCCGRSFISTGLLPEAIDQVDATIERLRPLIDDERVEAILVAEPSCLSAIKDDWLQLNLQAPIALRKKLAAKCFLPEEFLARADHALQLKAMCDDADGGRLLRPVVLHGHCHQKALWGAESSAKILREILGDDLKVLDTGCCGMAGSFGFTTDRYDLSMRIGELTLFPALRDAPHAEVCAPGTSCRHQIHDGAGRKAVHPIELIAERITGVPSKPE
jgi:Fe-S oxidoreductase